MPTDFRGGFTPPFEHFIDRLHSFGRLQISWKSLEFLAVVPVPNANLDGLKGVQNIHFPFIDYSFQAEVEPAGIATLPEGFYEPSSAISVK